MSIGSWVRGWKLKDFFVGLFSAARKAFSKLSQEEKEALIAGSSIVDIINTNIDRTSSEIIREIKTRHPELSDGRLEAALFEALHHFNIAITHDSLDDLIIALKNYLKKLEGDKWKAASHGAAVVMAAILSPKETKFATIVSLIEFVFRVLIKKQ
jgi:hypothetical protein